MVEDYFEYFLERLDVETDVKLKIERGTWGAGYSHKLKTMFFFFPYFNVTDIQADVKHIPRELLSIFLLAHESTHIKQFERGQLDTVDADHGGFNFVWRVPDGKDIVLPDQLVDRLPDHIYNDLPWEREANEFAFDFIKKWGQADDQDDYATKVA